MQDVIAKTPNSVGVYFFNNQIAGLFADLLTSMRINNQILGSGCEINKNEYLITENQYYLEHAGELAHKKCIIVGDDSRIIGKNVVQLTQPLTESKVISALSYLLELH